MAICHNGKEGGLVSRRSFLKGGVAVGGAALVGGVLGGCSPQQSGSDAAPLSPVGLPETWDAESDVVIAGFGGAVSSGGLGGAKCRRYGNYLGEAR